MSVVRHGNRTGFFDGSSTFDQTTNPNGGVAVPMGAFSQAQQVGRDSNSIAIYLKIVNPGFATVWQMQAAHSGGMTNARGEPVDQSTNTLVWHDAWYFGMVPVSETTGTQGSTNLQLWIPSTGGAIMNLVPDWVPGWVRLARVDAVNTPVTVTAGWESQSE